MNPITHIIIRTIVHSQYIHAMYRTIVHSGSEQHVEMTTVKTHNYDSIVTVHINYWVH